MELAHDVHLYVDLQGTKNRSLILFNRATAKVMKVIIYSFIYLFLSVYRHHSILVRFQTVCKGFSEIKLHLAGEKKREKMYYIENIMHSNPAGGAPVSQL